MKQIYVKEPYVLTLQEIPVMHINQRDLTQTLTSVTSPVSKSENSTIIDKVVDTATETKDMLVDETRTLAPNVVKTLKESENRLNKEDRILSFMPNTYLYYGIIGLGIYIIVKKII